MLAELRREHDELRRWSAEIRDIVRRPSPNRLGGLAEARRKFVRVLTDHVTFECELNIEAHERSGSEAVRNSLGFLQQDLVGWMRDLAEHVEQWPSHRVGAGWERYRNEELDLLANLDDYLVREERQLYPLLELI